MEAKVYKIEEDGQTFEFTEKDLDYAFGFALGVIKDSLPEAKRLMGNRYTSEVDAKVQSVLDAFIISALREKVKVYLSLKRRLQSVDPHNALHEAFSIGSMANGTTSYCRSLSYSVTNRITELGVPIRKPYFGREFGL